MTLQASTASMNGKPGVPRRFHFRLRFGDVGSSNLLQLRRHFRTTHRQRRLFDRRQFALFESHSTTVSPSIDPKLVGHALFLACAHLDG